jgi:hypothetical protein
MDGMSDRDDGTGREQVVQSTVWLGGVKRDVCVSKRGRMCKLEALRVVLTRVY